MRLSKRKQNGVLVVRPSGELDQHSADVLRSQLDAALAEPDVVRIEFDMSGVTFMDSAGVGVLLGRYRLISKKGGSMGVYGASKSVERILRMSGVYTIASERSCK